MGTNYYAVAPGRVALIHLGKMSAGWPFLFRCHKEWTNREAMEEWIATAQSYTIEDEYGREISFKDLMSRITTSLDEHSDRQHEYADFAIVRWQFARGDFC